jgi:hypothetical protein
MKDNIMDGRKTVFFIMINCRIHINCQTFLQERIYKKRVDIFIEVWYHEVNEGRE